MRSRSYHQLLPQLFTLPLIYSNTNLFTVTPTYLHYHLFTVTPIYLQ